MKVDGGSLEDLSSSLAERRSWIGQFLFLSVSLALAYAFTLLRFEHNLTYSGVSLQRLTQGTALVPYQYRALIPWLVAAIQSIPFIELSLRSVYFAFEVGSIVLALFAFRTYLGLLFRNTALASLLSLTLLYPLTSQFLVWEADPTFYYPYDMPSVFFFTLGLVFLYREKYAGFYLLFLVATLNRETSCFLTVIFLFTAFPKKPLKHLAIHAFAQIAIWVSVKGILLSVYSDNLSAANSVAGVFDNNLSLNLNRLSHPESYVALLSVVGFLWLPTILSLRMIRDDFARRSLAVCGPFLLGMFFVGNIVEVRIFSELIPVVLSGFLLSAHHLVGQLRKRAV